MLSTRMDLDLTSTEDGFIFKEQLNDNLYKNNKEQGKNSKNESKDPEESINMDTHEEFSRSIDLPVDASNDRLQSPARKSNSAGSLAPSEKADEQVHHWTKESDLHYEFQGSNLVHSSKVPISMVDDYECHTDKQEPNAARGLPYDNVNETSTLGMEAGDSDQFLSQSYHEHRNLTLSQRQNGQIDTISIDCSSDIANNDNNKYFGSIVDETKLNGDYQMIGVVPSHDGEVVREICHSPEKETPVSGDHHDRSPETELLVRQDQRLPEVEEAKSSNSPKQLSFPDMDREWSIMQSPVRCRAASVSPERQKSSTLKRSPDKNSISRPDDLPIKKGDKKPTHSRKHTPSPERHISGKKRASSHERLSPSVRRKFSGKTISENAHRDHSPKISGKKVSEYAHRDHSPKISGKKVSENAHRNHSPKRCLPSPPRRRVSPLKRGKSVSQSPVRRKDSSIIRKDHKGRSRSRSPNTRDHYVGSSRRRHSPRRRSPPSSSRSRHRSPRRPWSPPPNRNTGVGTPGRNLFVAGFSYATTERDLENKFSRYGRVRGVRIVRDKRSGESRGFGFVSLEKDEEADAAIRAIDRTEWNGRIVLVEKSKTPAR